MGEEGRHHHDHLEIIGRLWLSSYQSSILVERLNSGGKIAQICSVN